MIRIIFILLIIPVLCSSCSNESSDYAILKEPPYDKITDSIERMPKNPELYFHRAALLYSNNQLGYAEKDLQKAWLLQPKEEYALSLVTILKIKRTDSAIQFIKTALNQLPNSIALKIGLARGYQQKNDLNKAMSICNEIINQFPNQLDALIFKSDLLKEENKPSEALTYLEKAYSFSPNDKELAYNLDYDLAEAKNSRAISLSDTLLKEDNTATAARAFYVKATYYKNINNTDEALKNYDLAIAKDYNFLDAYLDKGQLLYRDKNFKAALNNFQLALKVSPTTADFYFWLAKTQQSMGKKEDAKLNFQRAYGLDKTMKGAKEAADSL